MRAVYGLQWPNKPCGIICLVMFTSISLTMESKVLAYEPRAIRSPPKNRSLSSHDMRSFSFHGPFGLNLSFGTIVPGTLSLSFSSNRRATSEPALPETNKTSSAESSSRQYAAHIELGERQESQPIPTPSADLGETESRSRESSPVATEILEPEPDDILVDLKRRGIKVLDFGFSDPVAAAEPGRLDLKPTLSTVTEIFNPSKGIAEYEYRAREEERTYPIAGKTLRRLLDMGLIKMEEAQRRLCKMDWDELKAYDARESRHPWRPCQGLRNLDDAARQQAIKNFISSLEGTPFCTTDEVRKAEKAESRYLEKREALEQQTGSSSKRISQPGCELDKAKVNSSQSTVNPKKRSLERSASIPNCSDLPSTSASPKRQRTGRPNSTTHVSPAPLQRHKTLSKLSPTAPPTCSSSTVEDFSQPEPSTDNNVAEP